VAGGALDDLALASLGTAFMRPIFDLARPYPQTPIVLECLRRRGIKTAIVSNTPWGSPSSVWRTELARHGLLERVDAVVFCVDVGWRKPHRAPFDRALALLDVAPTDAVFDLDGTPSTTATHSFESYSPINMPPSNPSWRA
jgi:putative hydrolase of the HAD superfamily